MVDSEKLLGIWKKARPIAGLDEAMYRKDACGALIMWNKYGLENPYGWVIDHIYPRSEGGNDVMDNLRPLHYLNNLSKSDDYPSYTATIRFDGTKNIKSERNLVVNDSTRKILREHFKGA